jgi:hypothetical protein
MVHNSTVCAGLTRCLLCLLTLLLVAVAGAFGAAPAQAAASAAETELAQRYAPVLRFQSQPEECGPGEPYRPMDVTALLPDSGVAFRGPWATGDLIKVAPTGADLREGWTDYHLDFPGEALSPGCAYEKWARRVTAGRPPTVYAHVATEADRPGKLALQYWFFYGYNDFNNKHEGDWEMIQLLFDAPGAPAALEADPEAVGYTQHSSAERAEWGSDKLQLVDGTHPVVYSAAGSHANFYDAALHLGNSAEAGVGCDDTSGPHDEVEPATAVVPSETSAYLQEFPWLGFRGRWGERQDISFYNGPTGPNMKERWTEPIQWTEDRWRADSASVPLGGLLGPNATEFFCTVVGKGSETLVRLVRNPVPTVILLLLLVAAVTTLVTRTRWTPSDPLPVRRPRHSGQIVSAAWQLYRRQFGTLLAIGSIYLPVMLFAGLLEQLLVRTTGLDTLTGAGVLAPLVTAILVSLSAIASLAGWFVVLPAVAIAVAAVERGQAAPLRGVLARLRARHRPIALVAVVLVTVTGLLLVPIITVPLALVYAVRHGLAVQVAAVEDRDARGSLGRCRDLVTGHAWRVALLGTLLVVCGTGLGPLLGVVWLLVAQPPLALVNALSAVASAITVPFVAVSLALLYFDLAARHDDEQSAEDRASSPRPPGSEYGPLQNTKGMP